MINLFSIVAIGFFLGMRHATDPDHVAAVTTMVTRQRELRRAALIGTFWGLGHTVTIFLVGAAIILFDVIIPPRIGLSMELSVGAMLVVLGIANVKSFLASVPEAADQRAHQHEQGEHVHMHSLCAARMVRLDRVLTKLPLYQHLRPLAIGIVHGLAGSAAVALLVLATIHNARWAVAYLLVFGVGTIAGMMVITMSIASALNLAPQSAAISRRLALASGLVSLAFGLIVAFQICFGSGLLSAHPQWTPK